MTTNIRKVAEPELSQAAKFKLLPKEERERRLARLSERELYELEYNWKFHRRPKQTVPEDEHTILATSGRAFGKTRMLTEWVRERWQAGKLNEAALIADTPKDAVATCINGKSGLMRIHPYYERPKFNPSKTLLTWPRREDQVYPSTMLYYSAEDPESLRGLSADTIIVDELAKFKKADEVYQQIDMVLREGNDIRLFIATTPRPIPIIKDLMHREDVYKIYGSSYENTNLSERFFQRLESEYEGGRYGKQEIWGELLEDLENALWKQSYFHPIRDDEIDLSQFERVVVGVDPSGASEKDQELDRANAIGIVVVGKFWNENKCVVLADYTKVMSPEEWGETAAYAYDKWQCDKIVVEKNFGGDMCRFTIQANHPNLPVELVTASRGKHIRAEPVSMLYARNQVLHRVEVDEYGIDHLQGLQEEMLNTTPVQYEGRGSPNRMDAAVFAITDLMIDGNNKLEVF